MIGAACRAGTGGGPQTGHILLIGSSALPGIGLAGEEAESLRDGLVTVARGVLIDHGRAGAGMTKGAPPARQPNRPRPGLARMRGTCTESVNERVMPCRTGQG